MVAPEAQESRSPIAAFLHATRIITPHAYTWICEDRWRLLGVAQAVPRPGGRAWDLACLAALTPPPDQPANSTPADILFALAQYALNTAIQRGVHRFFVRVEDDRPENEIFSKLGFQRYARELTYVLPNAACGLTRSANEREDGRVEIHVRPWNRHDAWGLLQLYDALTPHRVRIAESLTNDELLHTRAGGGRTWHLPLLEPPSDAYVYDKGVRLGGWLRLRHGRGSQPHQLCLMAHPDDPESAPALVRFGLRLLAGEADRPVVCAIREYEGAAIDALRAAGFEHADTHALLVRHLTMQALRKREVAVLEPRVVYGVKGLGQIPSRLSEGETTHYATRHH
jgi:hypothetical protein